MEALELRLLKIIEHATGLRLKSNQVTQSHTALLQLSLERNEDPFETLIWLESEPSVLEGFSAQFTIPETHFHRIQPQMQVLRQRILPHLFNSRLSRRAWRFWSAGCSSGEEVYTLIILALEFLNDQPWQLEVLGTDLNPVILERAKAALYNEWSFRDTPMLWREHWFTKQADTWQLLEKVRQYARFERLNLIADAWQVPSEMDLILCRNVTIYFSNRTAQKIYERLAARLSMGGWLVLGPSDPPPTRQTLEKANLQPIFEDGAIIWQRVSQVELTPHLARVPWLEEGMTPSLEVMPRPSKNPSLEFAPRLSKTPSLEFQFKPKQPTLEIPRRPPTKETAPANATVELPPYEPPLDLNSPVPIVRSQNSQTLEGLNYLEQNKPQAALEVLRRAAYLEPNDPVTQFALARACLMLGDKKRAQTAMRQSRRLIASLPDDALLSLETSVKDLHRALTALANQLR
jgi:chemotaxis protein methyltransferase CheR